MINNNLNFIPPANFHLMGVTILEPPATVSRWVQCFCLIDGRKYSESFIEEKLYPDAGTSLTFTVNEHNAHVSFLNNTQVFIKRWNMLNNYIIIRFKPGGAFALLGLDVSEIRDIDVDFTDLNFTHKIHTSLLLDTLPKLNIIEQHRLLQDWLINLFCKASPRFDKLDALLLQASENVLSPLKLAEYNGVGHRTLQRYVRKHLGTTTNKLHCFAQIRSARQKLILTSNVIADIGLDCGYFDQSHFTNAFREHTLETPLQYRKRKLSQISNNIF